jgi:hypothetical protein
VSVSLSGGPPMSKEGDATEIGTVAIEVARVRRLELMTMLSSSSAPAGVSVPAGGDRDKGALVLRYGLTCRDVGEHLAERGVTGHYDIATEYPCRRAGCCVQRAHALALAGT